LRNVTEIREKESKNGKPFLIINIDDTTGRMSGLYFAKKSTYHKIKDITVGEAIIARGNISERNGKPSFTFEKINRCTFPTDFVKKEKYKKQAPREYKNIFPTPAKTKVKVKSVFDAEEVLPPELMENTFVVFDLETTGLDHLNQGITEIGAVKMVDGKLVEEFSTLVKPDYPITEENAKITGITEEMVKDAPKINTVIPDFMKFIDGAVLVGQNIINFDMKFLRRFCGGLEYEIKNKTIDTMDLARQTLPRLRKHDLHTLAEYFGITFQHHRATSDAYATAEVLIELLKIKNNL
jgi:DNA polymerase III epsilon subunit family exonuclease